MKGAWEIYVNPEDKDQTPHLVFRDSNANQPRIPTIEEMTRAVRMLNEEGSTVIRLSCHNPDCKDKGGWIERARKDAEKNVYRCEVCGGKMER